MINRAGLSGVVKNLTPTPTNNTKQSSSTSIIGRVIDIILDENHPKYQEIGLGTSGIGIVFIENVGRDNIGTAKMVKPYFPNIKNYPLVNEFVYCFYLPTPTLSSNSDLKREYYYLPNFGLWNTPHFNALPPFVQTPSQPSQNNGYQQVEAGAVNITSTQPNTLSPDSPINPSQNTFVEKPNIHPLMPFAGDNIYEGRFGNSLRFGSTAKSKSTYKNNWSENGNNGDPITILRNGQPQNVSQDGWIPTTENISNDLSSVYLTSYQKIPFSIANENFISYTNKPITPSQFSSPQIIANADRVVINAKKDSVLISGEKAVGLSSNESINIESNQIYLEGNDVRLGSKNASQSVLKGDDTVDYLKIILTELQNISEALKSIQDWPGGAPIPNPAMLTVATVASQTFSKVANSIDKIKSDFVKTT
jgi:hypothetical protein